VLIVLSDLHQDSKMISGIIQKILSYKRCRVILVAKHVDAPIVLALSKRKIKYSLILESGSFWRFRNFMSIFNLIYKDDSDSILISGYRVQFVSLFISSLVGKSKRCFIRHYNREHHRIRTLHWYFLDLLSNYLSTHIIAVSELTKNVLSRYELVPEKKISVIYNSIDVSRFAGIKSSESHRLREGMREPLKVLVVARLVQGKGIEHTLDAFESFLVTSPGAKLRILGAKGNLADKIISRVNEFNPSSVELFTEFGDVVTSIKWADVLTHVPISVDSESFGLVYLEGLCAGIECVFTESGILGEGISRNLIGHYWRVPFKSSSQVLSAWLSIERGSRLNTSPVNLANTVFDVDYCANSYFEYLCSNKFI
jgi:glycosyltransferase involved in cell wall biosynthesis